MRDSTVESFDNACTLIRSFKGDTYVFGMGVLGEAGRLAQQLGTRAVLVRDAFPGSAPFLSRIQESLRKHGVELLQAIDGAAPNAPREDLARITQTVAGAQPDLLISFGGGSTIDALKAAEVLRTLGGAVDDYFGTNAVSQALGARGSALTPHLAIQTAASSGSHLTKYSNITDLKAGQKKLLVDEALVPARALFDYEVTLGAPAPLTADGALDGVSHVLEVLYGAVGKPHYGGISAIARENIRLVMRHLPRALKDPRDREARHALGLATDLGGYAIMLGGTNGAHLTSFSLIDILTHGRACALLNPYYTVFFGPAIQEPLRLVLRIAVEEGYAPAAALDLRGRALAVGVAEALIAFEQAVGLPARLCDVPGFTPEHVARALTAAKNPQLKMKLENMPVPLTSEQVDEYMGRVLEAASTGNLGLIRELRPYAPGEAR